MSFRWNDKRTSVAFEQSIGGDSSHELLLFSYLPRFAPRPVTSVPAIFVPANAVAGSSARPAGVAICQSSPVPPWVQPGAPDSKPSLNNVERGATNNAAVSWFVFGDTAGGAADMLEYKGTAFATIKDGPGDTFKVKLHEGTLQPCAARGALTDPIGVGKLEGTFTAVQNPHRVQELLAAARARTADASAAAR